MDITGDEWLEAMNLSVEMETATTFAVARHFQMAAVSIRSDGLQHLVERLLVFVLTDSVLVPAIGLQGSRCFPGQLALQGKKEPLHLCSLSSPHGRT